MTAHYSLAEIRKSYGGAKARDEAYGEWVAALIYRPLSFWLTALALRLNYTATAVTAIGLALALLLPAFAVYCGPVSTGLAAILISVLDCVDGNIARVTGTASKLGHYLDFITDIVFRIALYAAIGVLASGGPPAIAALDGHVMEAVLLAALLGVAARLSRVYAEGLSGRGAYEAPSEKSPGLIARVVFPLLSGIDGLLPFAVLASAAWPVLDAVIVALVLYTALDFVYTQSVILRRLSRR